MLARYASAVREVDISLSVSKGKGDDRQKCEFTVFLKRLGVVCTDPLKEKPLQSFMIIPSSV